MRNIFLLILLLISFSQCSSKEKIKNLRESEELVYIGSRQDSINQKIQFENKRAWAEAFRIRDSITDSGFLQTKRPMSDDAIAPYNYATGLVEDRAYNRVIYIKAFERAKKKLFLFDDQLICNLKSGAEINISEDLYNYIMNLFAEWNLGVKEGRYKIIKDSIGYDILPILK